MKKYLPLLSIPALMALNSCMQEDIVKNGGQEVTAKVSITLPGNGAQSRTGDADASDTNDPENPVLTSNMRLFIFVYQGEKIVDVIERDADFSTTNSFIEDIRLVTGQPYTIAAWADYDNETTPSYYNVNQDNGTVELIDTDKNSADIIDRKGNDTKNDAFFATIDKTLENNETISLTLKRPFGLVQVTTNDWSEGTVVNAGFRPEKYTCTISVPTKLTLRDGALGEKENVVFSGSISNTEESYTETSNKLSFDYIFANDKAQTVLDKFTTSYLKESEEICSYEFNSIPVQANYITNISGNVLTKNGKVDIKIEQAWDTSDISADIVETTAANLQTTLDNAANATYKAITLTDEINDNMVIKLPAIDKNGILVINMLGVSEDGNVTFKDDDKNFYGSIKFTNTDAEGVHLTVNVPNGDAIIGTGKWPSITSTTRPNTLKIEGGVEVGTITVAGGNVIVNEGATVDTIDKANENTENTIVTVVAGATVNTIDESITKVEASQEGPIFNASSNIYFNSIRDAVIAAAEGDVIEIAEGKYDLGEPGQPDANSDPRGYYLKIDKKGLTLKGNGNVEIYTSHDANTGNWSLQNLVTVRAENVTFENITFIANYNGYYKGNNKTIEVANNEGNNFTIRNCKLIDSNNKTDAGCLYIGTDSGNTTNATVENCTFVNSAVNVRVTSTVEIKGCTFNGVRERDGWNCSVAVRGNATVEDCTFTNIQDTHKATVVVANGNGYINLVNNTFPSSETYWQTNDNGLILFNGAYTFSGGKGTYEDPYLLSTPEDVLMIGKLYTAGKYESIYSAAFKMTQDIDISATPIRNLGVMGFLLDGDNHTLTVNLTSESTVGVGKNVGLFAAFNGKGNTYIYENASDPNAYELNGKKYTIKGGCIRDLVINGTVSSSIDGAVASLVGGSCTGYIINVTNNATINASNGASFVGGIVSYVKGTGLIFDCTNNGAITVTGGDNARPVGGITAQSYGGSNCDGTYPDIFAPYSASVNNCKNTGNITTDTYDVGGIMGQTHGYGNTKCITNCSNSGDIKGTKNVGGILGRHCSTGGKMLLSGNSNSGNITATIGADSGSIYGKNEGTLLEGSQAQS